MIESIKAEVNLTIGKDEVMIEDIAEISIDTENNVFELSLKNTDIIKISGDWHGNFKEVFERTLELWGNEKEEEKR